MASEENKESQSQSIQSSIFSPRFKSMAAMAGWDEETLLSASLIVDDTPDRELTLKKRSVLQFKTPPTTDSRKKRRVQRSPVPIVALDLNDAGATRNEKEEKEPKRDVLTKENSSVSCSSASLPCMDKLREELSCAICLDICFEPSTTACGHSFCLKCLRFAASKCGKKCPKCRQIISNGRSCTVNTVLWNTIQLLFPEEVEAKKAAGALNSRESKHREKISESAFYDNLRNVHDSEIPERVESTTRRRRAAQSQNEDDPIASLVQEIRRNVRASRGSSRNAPSQDEDAALALRLQREEFMGAVRGTSTTTRFNQSNSSTTSEISSTNPIRANNRSVSLTRDSETTRDQSNNTSNGAGRSSSSFSLARANLRAMASRATQRVSRGWNL